jgi:prophage antirepressor-like protein
MKSNIQIFKNEVFGEIRTCQVNNQIMFVGKDVATALGYANTRKAVLDHVDKEDREDGVTIRDAIGRDQKATFINESGLYSLILSSKLPQAKAFKRWVTAEVLPQIRQTGGYIPTRDADGRELLALGVAMAIQENGLIKREQSELAHSAEREDGRAKLNGTDSLDYFAMLRGWGLAREGI